MRLFAASKESSDPSPYQGAAAVLDGAGAAAHSERMAGSRAALAATGAARRAVECWRTAAHPRRSVEAASGAGALAAAGGLAEAGERATAFLTSPALLCSHEALYGMAGKHLPLLLHVAAQAAPRPGWSEQAGHEALHALADAGWVQFMAADAQSAADLAFIARWIAEQALVPALVAQDAWLTTHRAATLRLPEAALAAAYLGTPADAIACPTPAQRLLFGDRRRRVPLTWNLDTPLLSGAAHGADTQAEATAAQGPYALAHVPELAAQAMQAYRALTGRAYAAVQAHRCEDAEVVVVAMGSAAPIAMALADALRSSRRLKLGVATVTMLRPFPGAALAALTLGKRAVLVLENVGPSLTEEPPLLSALRAALGKAAENGAATRGRERHPAYPRLRRLEELPPLTAAHYGLGGRALQPGDLLAALENLAPNGPQRPRVWLGVEFLPVRTGTPKQEIFAQQLSDAYPELAAERLPAVEAPPLLPAGTLTLRVLAPRGREPFDSDAHLGLLLHELGGKQVQAGPAAGRARRGQPRWFTVLASDQPLPAGVEPTEADVVVVSEPSLLLRPELPSALKQGGTLLIVSEEDATGAGDGVWPSALRHAVATRGIHTLRFPGHALARQEARDPAAQVRVLGTLLQGALLACPPVVALTGLRDKALLRELRSALLRRHPEAEAAELEAELELLQKGAAALQPDAPPAEPTEAAEAAAAGLPAPSGVAPELRDRQAHPVPVYDLHRHWEAHPAVYHRAGDHGLGNGTGAATASGHTADPFVGSGVLPPGTGLLRDLSTERETYPHWLPQRCTGCGACWAICPDAALPGLVNTPAQVLETGQRVLEARGQASELLPRAVRVLVGKWREQLATAGVVADAGACLAAAIAQTLPAVKATPDEQAALADQLEHLREAVQPFPLAVTEPFFQGAPGGGLLSVTVDPERCKGCGACVQACPDAALEQRPQTPAALAPLRQHWAFWLRLPTSEEPFRLLGEARETAPRLETLLLDKRVYRAFNGGNEGDPGASENTVLHLFAAVAEAALQPAVAGHVQRLAGLIERLEGHIRLRLAVDVSDVDALACIVRSAGDADLTLADLSSQVDPDRTPIDRAWLARVTGTLAGLKALRRTYAAGEGGRPRSSLGMVLGLNETTAPLASWPFNAFAFPVSGQPGRSAAGTLEGLLEGALAHLADGFRLARIAELELDDKYTAEVHDAFFAQFDWPDFTTAEWALCPPLVLTGDETLLAGDAAGAVQALLESGRPVRVLCLDGHAWSALAAQPGTPAPFGEAEPGTGDAAALLAAGPVEPALQAIVRAAAYVEQGSLGDVPRLLEGFLRGLRSPRPALFTVFRAGLPAHGRADALAAQQSKLALESRAHPWLRYDPDAGEALHERLSLAGNPEPEAAWPTRPLEHRDAAGHVESSEMPLTFAHFALSVPALAHHFTPLSPDAPDEGLAPLAAYLDLDADEQRENRPIIAAADFSGHLQRWQVSAALVQAARRRREVWRTLRALTREDVVPVDEGAIAEHARGEVVDAVWRNLLELAQGEGGDATGLAGTLRSMARPAPANGGAAGGAAGAAAGTAAGAAADDAGEEGGHA